MASDMIRIKVGMAVSYIANSTREYTAEVPREEWEAMTEEEQAAYLDGLAQDEIDNYAEAWAILEEDED